VQDEQLLFATTPAHDDEPGAVARPPERDACLSGQLHPCSGIRRCGRIDRPDAIVVSEHDPPGDWFEDPEVDWRWLG
jgi:hypothetical protein